MAAQPGRGSCCFVCYRPRREPAGCWQSIFPWAQRCQAGERHNSFFWCRGCVSIVGDRWQKLSVLSFAGVPLPEAGREVLLLSRRRSQPLVNEFVKDALRREACTPRECAWGCSQFIAGAFIPAVKKNLGRGRCRAPPGFLELWSKVKRCCPPPGEISPLVAAGTVVSSWLVGPRVNLPLTCLRELCVNTF